MTGICQNFMVAMAPVNGIHLGGGLRAPCALVIQYIYLYKIQASAAM